MTDEEDAVFDLDHRLGVDGARLLHDPLGELAAVPKSEADIKAVVRG